MAQSDKRGLKKPREHAKRLDALHNGKYRASMGQVQSKYRANKQPKKAVIKCKGRK